MNMKKSIAAALAALGMGLAFSQTAAILDFDTEDLQHADRMPILTDTFRSEMANSKKLTVVDRKNTDAALSEIARSQTSDYVSQDNVKQIGRMLNADYIVVGHVKEIADDPVTVSREYTTVIEQGGGIAGALFGKKARKTQTITDTRDVTTQNKVIQIVVQMINVETSGVMASSHQEIQAWSEFSGMVANLARPLLNAVPKRGSFAVQDVNAGMFSGVWECELYQNGITDVYTLDFTDATTVQVAVESIDRRGNSTTASGTGHWRYNAREHVFVLTVNRLRGNIPHIRRIDWKSMISPADDEQSFTISIPASSTAGAKQVRGAFYRME